jgi:NAD+ kinase
VTRLGFAFNPTQPSALQLRDRGVAWCREHEVAAWVSPAGEVDQHRAELSASDAILVLGGDGTFLLAARPVAEADIPILGVNSGKVGFLSKAEHDDLEGVLGLLVAGEYELEPRMLLEARVRRAGSAEPEPAQVALNEAAVVRGAHPRVVRLEVQVDDSRLATYVCDGIVVATPTGSTGYSFSAGGPILAPTSRNLVLTPIAAYLSALRSTVIGSQHVVRVRILDAWDCLISIDGRDQVPLEVGDVVEVRAREAPLRFVEPRGALPFWDLLRNKAALLP